VTWNFDYLSKLESRALSRAQLLLTCLMKTGPRLLFVHGGFHGAWCWAPFLEFFANQGIPAGALNLPGHGGLAPPVDFTKLTVTDMADDVAEAARAVGGDVILVGHSLGGLTALAAAAAVKAPALILIAPAPPANVDGFKLLPPLPDGVAIAPPSLERTRKWFLAGYSGGDADAYQARLCPESPAFLNDVYRRRVTIDRSTLPRQILVLSGGRDDSPLHQAGQDEAVATFADAELLRIPEAGHCLMVDDMKEHAAQGILAWLDRNALKPAPQD